ncbi:sialin-like [Dermatophagoides pteronyssinus]
MIQQKWIISLLGIYSCALMFAQRAGFSVAMVRMTSSSTKLDNLTESGNGPPCYDWSETLQGIILGSSFYLYWLIPTIAGNFTEKYGGKWFAFIGVFIPCVMTMLIPWAANQNIIILIIIQIIIGATQAFTYPALFYLYVQWFPPEQRSKANSGIQIGVSLGSSIIYLIGGYLCETSIGWPLVFYVCSAFHIPWLILWLYFVDNNPVVVIIENNDDDDNNGKIKNFQNFDDKQQKSNEKKKIPTTPWLKIITSTAVWSSIISKSACSYGYFMFLSKLPSFLHSVYHIDITYNGFINSATALAYGITCFLSPYIVNQMIVKQYFKRPVIIRKLSQTIAMLVPAICLILITIFDKEDDKIIVIILLIIAMFGYGFVTGGEWTMVSDYAPNFVGTVSGITLMLGFINGILAPYIVGLILDSTIASTIIQRWHIAFLISAFYYIFALIIFIIFGTDQQQYWDVI